MGSWPLDIWQNGGQVVVIGLAGVGVSRVLRAPGAIRRNCRLADDLNEDLRRWVADRDRQLEADLNIISAYASDPDLEGPAIERLIGGAKKPVPEDLKHLPAGSLYHSGAHLRWRAGAKEQALHEYRDEATMRLRQSDDILAREGRYETWLRAKKNSRPLSLELDNASRSTLERWRAPVAVPGMNEQLNVVDATRGEERLLELERW